jgi:hypothetical protein
MALTLRCDDWKEEVFQYFVSDLLENWLPSPTSREPLKLQIYGSLAYCGCGNHRLPAQICWLAMKEGAGSKLRKVKADVYILNQSRLRLIRNLVSAGPSKLFLLRGSCRRRPSFVPENGFLFKTVSETETRLYHMEDGLEEIYTDERQPILKRLRDWWLVKTDQLSERSLPLWRRRALLDSSDWWEVPRPILEFWWNNDI